VNLIRVTFQAGSHGGMEAWRHGGMEAWRHGGRGVMHMGRADMLRHRACCPRHTGNGVQSEALLSISIPTNCMPTSFAFSASPMPASSSPLMSRSPAESPGKRVPARGVTASPPVACDDGPTVCCRGTDGRGQGQAHS
jgi:hypothetical protein